jgi:hypothetical protein
MNLPIEIENKLNALTNRQPVLEIYPIQQQPMVAQAVQELS